MGFLYGNLTQHMPRSHFNLSKVYSNRKAMHIDIETITEGEDGADLTVSPGSYLLVDYSYGDNSYLDNQAIDKAEYGVDNFDLTVWQVQMIKTEKPAEELPRCVAVARIHSILPTFHVVDHYNIDLLKPISTPLGEHFGIGKTIFPLDPETELPVG